MLGRVGLGGDERDLGREDGRTDGPDVKVGHAVVALGFDMGAHVPADGVGRSRAELFIAAPTPHPFLDRSESFFPP
mgnify:CR=1 FL=1